MEAQAQGAPGVAGPGGDGVGPTSPPQEPPRALSYRKFLPKKGGPEEPSGRTSPWSERIRRFFHRADPPAPRPAWIDGNSRTAIARELQDVANRLRRAPIPLADLIPLLQRAADALLQSGEDIAELEQTFELRWAADMRAIERWQAAHPGNDLRWPDHADLVVWLLSERDRAP